MLWKPKKESRRIISVSLIFLYAKEIISSGAEVEGATNDECDGAVADTPSIGSEWVRTKTNSSIVGLYQGGFFLLL